MNRRTTVGRMREAPRLLALVAALALLLLCTGCTPLLVDILYGDTCGDHDICESNAARAGAVAGAAALTGAVVQSKREEQDSASGDEPESDDGGDRGGSGDSDVDWSLNKRPTVDHVWDPGTGQWVLPSDKGREQEAKDRDHDEEMRRKGYEYDESAGDGGAWRKPVEKVEPVEIPEEKGDVTLPEYKPGIVSSQAEAGYQRLEDRFNQLNELEEKAIEEYKRIRNEIKEADEAGDSWLAEKLRNNLAAAKDKVDTVQEAKANLAIRHEYHSDEQFKKRYDKGWTAGAVAKELALDPFTHMIAPDMSDTVDVMANAIAARNRLQSQIGRQDSKLFGDHDAAIKELRDVIKARNDALQRGDADEAARLKDQGDAIKGRLNDLANRMDAVQKDVKDWEQKSLKATVETGSVATDRVGSGRAAFETGKMVAKKTGFQSERPEIKARKPTVEDQGAKAEAESKGAAKAEARAESTGSSRSEGARGGGERPAPGEGKGASPKKTIQQMVQENPSSGQETARRGALKAEWEQQYQEHAAQARAEGRVVKNISGRSLPATEQEWVSRDLQLGIAEAKGGLVAQWEHVGVDPSPKVLQMRAANPKFAEIDVKIRECWARSGPGVGPSFKPDYFPRFEENLRQAHISQGNFRNWLKSVLDETPYTEYVEPRTVKPPD